MKLLLIAAAVPALASAELDRSLMSDAYWDVWNDAEQARIDADIEKNRKADGAFRGFRGRYRLTWTGADGNRCEKLVDLE